MASIEDLYKKSEFSKLPRKGFDQTPISADGGVDIIKDAKKLEKARGGKLNEKKYSDSVTR
jgi:hypothetical protein